MMFRSSLFLSTFLVLSSCRPTAPLEINTLAASSNLDPDANLELHQFERWFEGEKEITQDAIEFGKTFAEKKSRDAHTKAHGCVKATFSVLESIPEDLKVGFFARPFSYRSWIRFSNSSPEIQPDGAGGALGMAIKIIGAQAPEESVAILAHSSQDFLTVNHPTFIVENIKDYMALQRSTLPFLATHPFTAAIILQIQARKIASPLETNYWSMSAFALGENSAVKYRAVPCSDQKTPFPQSPSDSMLSDNLAQSLSREQACFDFQVQRFVSLQKTPVENPMKEWKEEGGSPFVTVGKIIIPPQSFRTPGQIRFCENLSFNPWNTTKEHRPLGNINRARRNIYKEISRIRHEKGALPTQNEPTGHEVF